LFALKWKEVDFSSKHYEPLGSTHEVSNNASHSQPAKLLAVISRRKARN